MVNAMGLPFDLIDNVFCYISEPSDWFSLSLVDSEWNYVSKKYRKQMLLVKFTGKQNESDVEWIDISKFEELSEEFIRQFANNIDWYWISRNQKLSKQFIREFADKVNWYWIVVTQHQRLNKKFIREFADRVDWNKISYYGLLSNSLIRKLTNKVKSND